MNKYAFRILILVISTLFVMSLLLFSINLNAKSDIHFNMKYNRGNCDHIGLAAP